MFSVLDVLRDVVDPAVRAVLTPREVTKVEVQDLGDGDTMYLRLVAVDETFEDWVVQAWAGPSPPESWRERLRSNLVDFVAESRFGWGQNRENGPPA